MLLVVPVEAEAASFQKELRNAFKRGPKDGHTKFVLHMASGTIEITAADFDSRDGLLMGMVVDGKKPNAWDFLPSHIEMYKGSGDSKHNIMINLDIATYYRMDIDKIDGKWH